MDAAKFGTFLQARRKALGLTQAELAERLHVTDKAISRWERGVGLPDINLLEPLAEALALSLTELIRSETIDTDTLTKDAADAAVAGTLEILRAKRRHALLYWLCAIPVFGAEVFLIFTINWFVDVSWVRAVGVFLVVFCGSMGMRAVKKLLDYQFGLHAPQRRLTLAEHLRINLAILGSILLALHFPIRILFGDVTANVTLVIGLALAGGILIYELAKHVKSMPDGQQI